MIDALRLFKQRKDFDLKTDMTYSELFDYQSNYLFNTNTCTLTAPLAYNLHTDEGELSLHNMLPPQPPSELNGNAKGTYISLLHFIVSVCCEVDNLDDYKKEIDEIYNRRMLHIPKYFFEAIKKQTNCFKYNIDVGPRIKLILAIAYDMTFNTCITHKNFPLCDIPKKFEGEFTVTSFYISKVFKPCQKDIIDCINIIYKQHKPVATMATVAVELLRDIVLCKDLKLERPQLRYFLFFNVEAFLEKHFYKEDFENTSMKDIDEIYNKLGYIKGDNLEVYMQYTCAVSNRIKRLCRHSGYLDSNAVIPTMLGSFSSLLYLPAGKDKSDLQVSIVFLIEMLFSERNQTLSLLRTVVSEDRFCRNLKVINSIVNNWFPKEQKADSFVIVYYMTFLLELINSIRNSQVMSYIEVLETVQDNTQNYINAMSTLTDEKKDLINKLSTSDKKVYANLHKQVYTELKKEFQNKLSHSDKIHKSLMTELKQLQAKTVQEESHKVDNPSESSIVNLATKKIMFIGNSSIKLDKLKALVDKLIIVDGTDKTCKDRDLLNSVDCVIYQWTQNAHSTQVYLELAKKYKIDILQVASVSQDLIISEIYKYFYQVR